MSDIRELHDWERGRFSAKKKVEIKIGDRVQYSVKWLRSTGQYTGDIAHAKGIVRKITPLGQKSLATVAWGNENVPPTVLIDNLTKLK